LDCAGVGAGVCADVTAMKPKTPARNKTMGFLIVVLSLLLK
jgi:hypothetical protein